MKLRLYSIAALLLLAGSLHADDDATSPRLPSGIVDAKPNFGRSIKVSENQWMVSYRETIADGLSFEMVPVPGGRARIGSPAVEAGRRSDEGPQFEIDLAPFWIGATEVSWTEYSMYQATYKKFKQSKAAKNPDEQVDSVSAPTPIYEISFVMEFGGVAHPAVTMTHFGAMQYSKWLTLTSGNQYRLPTEVEWEHACRAGSDTMYSCGNNSDALREYARFDHVANAVAEGPLPVGSLKPNAFGIYDMHGNVAEWVIDQYSADAYQQLNAGDRTAKTVAIFGSDMYPHVIRGGGWMDPATAVRSAARIASSAALSEFDPDLPPSPHWHASDEARNIGFRVVRSLKPESVETIARFWNPGEDLALDIEELVSSGRGAIGVPERKDSIDRSQIRNPK